MTKLAILSVSAGAGHIRAAEAMRSVAETKGLSAVHIDLMDLVPKLFKKLYSETYIDLVNHVPELWGYMYNLSDKSKKSLLRDLLQRIERLNTRKLFKVLKDEAPDHILCTHFLPPQLLSRAIEKEKFSAPVWVQVTDFDIHRLWVHEHMQGYFVASDEVAWRLADRGIENDKINVTGIPIMPDFKKRFNKSEVLDSMNLKKNTPTLILMAGGAGVGDMNQIAERILNMNLKLQIIALAGKNKKLLAQLNELANKHQGKLVPMGFTTEIEKFMHVSDFAVTKPGGLTSSECLAMGLPMIIISPIPGQEERNSDYLLEHKAALKAYDTAGLEFKVQQLVQHPDRLSAMRKHAKSIGRADAASDVIQTILRHSEA